MNTKANFAAFIAELWKRFPLKTPKFFQILQAVGIVAAGIGFIPDALTYLELTPTPIMSHYLEIVLKVAGIVTWIMAKLPVENATRVSLNTNHMPFTAAAKKEAQITDNQTKK